jgi:hypothetical protein
VRQTAERERERERVREKASAQERERRKKRSGYASTDSVISHRPFTLRSFPMAATRIYDWH